MCLPHKDGNILPGLHISGIVGKGLKAFGTGENHSILEKKTRPPDITKGVIFRHHSPVVRKDTNAPGVGYFIVTYRDIGDIDPNAFPGGPGNTVTRNRKVFTADDIYAKDAV